MDSATYEVENQVENYHWWFVGRRALFRKIIEEFRFPLDAAILDIGTSTGTNLRMLKEMGFVSYQGLDMNDDAIRWCAEKGLGVVRKGDICEIPFPDGSFDLVLVTDIIEHVDDDKQALREVRRVLKSNGRALITVPAFESLWGLQDEVAHHKRRYRVSELEQKLKYVGLFPQELFYFNYLLFVPIWFVRQIIKLFRVRLKSENEINLGMINSVLRLVFLFDVLSSRRILPWFGVSILSLVGRRARALPSGSVIN